MKHSDVMRWLYSECDTVLTNSSLVSFSDNDQHIGLAREREDYPYPFVAIDHDGGEPRSAGIGADTLVVSDLSYDVNGILTEIVYQYNTLLDVTIQTLTDADRELRDDLSQEVQSHFALLSRQDKYHPDMVRLEVGSSTPTSRPDTFVYGDGIDMLIEYETYIVDSDPDVAEEVNVGIDVADDPDGTNADRAFDSIIN